MMRVVIVTGLSLCRNPRVVKEASSLTAAGYRVTVLGPAMSHETAREDATIAQACQFSHQRVVDLTAGRLNPGWARLSRRIGGEVVRWTGINVPQALGHLPTRTLRKARSMHADFYLGHLEVGVWVTERLAREGHEVGVDFEDWYSEDLLPEGRAQRPIRLLRRLEAAALRRGGHVTTTSHALAQRLAQEFNAPAPSVIYNAFPWSERHRLDGRRQDRLDTASPSLHWVSQTIGPGRGIEMLFEALHRVDVAVQVHLRGASSRAEKERLGTLFPGSLGHKLFFHEMVAPEELLSRIAEHDIGLALEPFEPLNKQFTVSNKILHYLLGGLAIVATDTAGQREVAEKAPGAVSLCSDPETLAAVLNDIISEPARLAKAKESALDGARKVFCWERQEPVFLESVRLSLGASLPRG